MDNLQIYNAVREVPKTAMKPIAAGRLKGMTDISPMWRIKCLTEQFGPVGIGWYYDIVEKWLEPGAGGEVAAFVRILLYIKYEGEWSKPIEGIGGSSFIASEKSGLHTSDECYKMALTDAISVACKALGMGADVYWQGDNTKYSAYQQEQPQEYKCASCGKPFKDHADTNGKMWTAKEWYHAFAEWNIDSVARCTECMNKLGTKKA
jgi:DNA-directed RNA polymerase subunit RPC12/RpoP